MQRDPLETKLNFSYPNSPQSSDGAPVMTQICHFLERGEITTCDSLYFGSNGVFLVALRNEGKMIRAIYKPCRGETPLYDFPDGTLYKREYAAFLISQALEWFLVPPTVIRSGPHGIGSMQWFVDTKNRVDYDSLRTRYLSRLKQVALFDYLVNNADRKAGHCLEGKDGRLGLVDHGLTFNTVPKLRTVIWDFSGQPISKKLVSDVMALQEKLKQEKSLREALYRLLAVSEVEALEFRLQKIIDNPVLPYPESRRSVPWSWM
ncbi:MAG: SCO1664 family protein [Chloroflexi bacterium]|nr:SCO1664 family protein [Chloroflexota bacterium]